jgi:hypothetical protein
MKTNKYYLLLGLLPVLSFLQMGCTHMPLETYSEEGPVNIAFNWSHLSMGDSIPKAMKLCFYGKGAVITRYCKDSVYSGKLPDGSYQVIAYNTDVKNVTYDYLDTYTGAEALAQTDSSTTAATYLSQPSHSYGIGLDSITVFGDSVVNETMSPLSFVKNIHVKYIVTGDKQAIASCQGSLSGLAMSVNIATGKPIGTTGTILFATSPTTEGYESTVTFMGVSDSTTTKTLSMILTFTGGGSQTVDVDVTPTLTGLDETVIPIDVNLTVAVTGTVEAGFSATLTGWTVDTENVTVE